MRLSQGSISSFSNFDLFFLGPFLVLKHLRQENQTGGGDGDRKKKKAPLFSTKESDVDFF